MMRGDRQRVVVVGAGLAGARTCEQLRRQGFSGSISLVGRETSAPYDRPPLSKAVLLGQRENTLLGIDLAAAGVDVLLDEAAIGLDLATRVVHTTGRRLPFDALVIATGADPVRLPGPGPQTTLRTVEDALALRAELSAGASVAIIGASWIGAEVASAAVARGCRVACAEAGPTPVWQSMGAEVGRRLASWWQAVDLRTGVAVSHVDDVGVVLKDGSHLSADVVVTGVGVRAATSWLTGSGLPLDRGVLVDESLRAAPGIVAVGDVAARWSPRYDRRVRVEHWDNAATSARVAATTILADLRDGTGEIHDPVPYFWSDQFGHKVQYAGLHSSDDQLTWQQREDGPAWSARWLDASGAVTAVLAVDWPAQIVQARRELSLPPPANESGLRTPPSGRAKV
jgi:NADPH-dependent 2,4-dienoyl-CoA reductase/sulfur reductase-like enzyme